MSFGVRPRPAWQQGPTLDHSRNPNLWPEAAVAAVMVLQVLSETGGILYLPDYFDVRDSARAPL